MSLLSIPCIYQVSLFLLGEHELVSAILCNQVGVLFSVGARLLVERHVLELSLCRVFVYAFGQTRCSGSIHMLVYQNESYAFIFATCRARTRQENVHRCRRCK